MYFSSSKLSFLEAKNKTKYSDAHVSKIVTNVTTVLEISSRDAMILFSYDVFSFLLGGWHRKGKEQYPSIFSTYKPSLYIITQKHLHHDSNIARIWSFSIFADNNLQFYCPICTESVQCHLPNYMLVINWPAKIKTDYSQQVLQFRRSQKHALQQLLLVLCRFIRIRSALF